MASVIQAVNEREKASSQKPWLGHEAKRSLGIILGSVIYALGVNLFLRPLNLYSGGIMGFSQLFTTILRDYLGMNLGKLDLSGVFYYVLNIPGLVVAWFTMGRKFFIKTIFTVSCMTLILTLIPIPDTPILEETLANCLVAGIMSGGGIGLILRMGACDGGMDLIGMILIQKKGNYSVGEINIAANVLLYLACLLLFDIPTVIYSLIYSVMSSMLCDRVHTQNINVQALIVTQMQVVEPLEIELMGQLSRGITRWNAYGGYTGHEETVLMVIISKYEIAQLRAIVHQIDPGAFVIVDEGISVDGHFLKKLT